MGRFLSVDPVTASSINGGNFNRYWYANNNPYKFTDPDGRLACTGSVQKSDCIRPASFPSNWGNRGRPDVGLFGKSGGNSSESNGTKTFGEKLARNIHRVADSLTVEGWGGARIGAKIKIGSAKADLQLGAAKWGGGISAAGDAYAVTDTARGAVGLEVGGIGLRRSGGEQRSLVGRDGGAWYREENTPASTLVGIADPAYADPSSGTIGISVGVGLGIDVNLDVGRAAVGLFYWGDSELEP